MSKVRLLNDGSYGGGLDEIDYPVEVKLGVHDPELNSVYISGSELVRIGGESTEFPDDQQFIFFLGSEAELI